MPQCLCHFRGHQAHCEENARHNKGIISHLACSNVSGMLSSFGAAAMGSLQCLAASQVKGYAWHQVQLDLRANQRFVHFYIGVQGLLALLAAGCGTQM